MQLLTKNLIKASISVYDGISPALLATISLSQNIKGSNHQELVNSLKKSNIIQSQSILTVLQNLDRAMFTPDSKAYDNKPNKISKGQNMTDIFSHAIVLNNIQPHLTLKPRPKILDIGTGHGYLAFAVWNLALTLSKQPQVLGIDCYDECIQKCLEIKNKINIKAGELEFRKMDVKEVLQQGVKYDVIVGGFFMEPNLSNRLQSILQEDGMGIWPQVSQAGQGLFITRKNKPKEYLLETLFSQQVVHSSVEEYFINEHSAEEYTESQEVKELNEEEKKLVEESMRAERNERKKGLQALLKAAIDKHQKENNLKTLTLKQMQTVPQISHILEQLKRYK